MRKSRFREEQIVGILKEHAAGEPTGALCRRHGISQQTLYRWKAEVRRPGRKRAQTAEGAGRGERPAQTPRRRASARQPGPQGAPPKKLVRPAQRRAAVAYVQDAVRLFPAAGLSAGGQCRSTIRYQPTSAAMIRAARSAPGAGGATSALRLSAAACAAAPGGDRRQPQARGAAVPRGRLGGAAANTQTRRASGAAAQPCRTRANEQWALDFLQDALASGRKLRAAQRPRRLHPRSARHRGRHLAARATGRVGLGAPAGERDRPRAARPGQRPGTDQPGARRSGRTSTPSPCASSAPASRSRTPSARASTVGCATSASTSTGSSASAMPAASWKTGARTTIGNVPIAGSATRPRPSSPKARSRQRRRCQTTTDSHNSWTKQWGQVVGSASCFSVKQWLRPAWPHALHPLSASAHGSR